MGSSRYPISPASNPCCNATLKIGVVLSLRLAMRRRSRAGSTKPQRRKAIAPKRPGGTEAARPVSSSAISHESEAARLASELAAMGEILRLISDSPGNLGAVLQSVAEQAAQICQAQ